MSRLGESEVISGFLDRPRRVWVQAPLAGKPTADCLVFLDAEFYLEEIQAPEILANLQEAGEVPSLTSIYISHVDLLARARELTCDPDFGSFVAIDLCRWIAQAVGRFDRVHLCGLSLSGLAAVFIACEHPTVFHGILAQSPSAWWNDEALLASLAPNQRNESRIWISVGDEETEENVMHSRVGLFQKTSQRDSARRLAEALKGRCQALRYEEFSGGHDMACWAAELPQALAWLVQDRDLNLS